jgi:hypothetical protein
VSPVTKGVLWFVVAIVVIGVAGGMYGESQDPDAALHKAERGEADKIRTTQLTTALKAKKALLAHAYDPESVRFEDIYVSLDAKYACLRVNAKNKFGGYAGTQTYLYTAGTVTQSVPLLDKTCFDKKMKFVQANI